MQTAWRTWVSPLDDEDVDSKPLVAEIPSQKRPRDVSLTKSGRPTKRRNPVPPSDEFWFDERDCEDSSSSEEDLEHDSYLPRKVARYATYPVERWVPDDPSPPASPPRTPILASYRTETTFRAPDADWATWPQVWRSVVIRSG